MAKTNHRVFTRTILALTVAGQADQANQAGRGPGGTGESLAALHYKQKIALE